MVYLGSLASRLPRRPAGPHRAMPRSAAACATPRAGAPARAGAVARHGRASPSAVHVAAVVVLGGVVLFVAAALVAAAARTVVAPLVTILLTVGAVGGTFLAVERLTRPANAAVRGAATPPRANRRTRRRRC